MQQEEEAAVQQQQEAAVAMEAAVVVQQPQQGSSSSAAASSSSSSSAAASSSRKRSRSAAALPAAALPAAAMCELVVRVRGRCRAREGAALRGARCAAAPPARVCASICVTHCVVRYYFVSAGPWACVSVRAWSYSLLRPIFYTPLDSLTKFLSERTRSPFGRSDRCLARGREHGLGTHIARGTREKYHASSRVATARAARTRARVG